MALISKYEVGGVHEIAKKSTYHFLPLSLSPKNSKSETINLEIPTKANSIPSSYRCKPRMNERITMSKGRLTMMDDKVNN